MRIRLPLTVKLLALGALVIAAAGCGGGHSSNEAFSVKVDSAAFNWAADKAQAALDNRNNKILDEIHRTHVAQTKRLFTAEQAFHAGHGRYSTHLLADFGLSQQLFQLRDISTDGQKVIVDVQLVATSKVHRLENELYVPYRFRFHGKIYLADSKWRYFDTTPIEPPLRVVIDHGRMHTADAPYSQSQQ